MASGIGRALAGGGPPALPLDVAHRSADVRVRTMASILELAASLAPADLACFCAVGPRLEKYAVAPIVTRVAAAATVDPDRQIARYRRHFARNDPFAPRRVARGVRLLTVQDLEAAHRDQLPPPATEPVTPRAAVYLRDAGQIVAAISLARTPQQPDLSAGEVAIIRTAQPVFEAAYNLARHASSRRSVPHAALTHRERDVAALVARGASNLEISQALGVTPNTVKVHVKHLFEKLGVTNRYQAMLLLNADGLGVP